MTDKKQSERTPNITSAVAMNSMLSLKVNIGKRHRIMNSGVSNGSLWITPQKNNYYVLLSGDVIALVSTYMHSHYGNASGEDQEHPYWYIPDIEDVERIIGYFGQT